MVETEGFDLPCGAGHLGLQGAPGALPSALGFESLTGDLPKAKTAILVRMTVLLLENVLRFDRKTLRGVHRLFRGVHFVLGGCKCQRGCKMNDRGVLANWKLCG